MEASDEYVLGCLAGNSEFAVEVPQTWAWRAEIAIMRVALTSLRDRGWVFFEFVLPRLGRRMDVAVVVDHVLFVIEFKVGERAFSRSAIDQVWDYALDLKNFHQPSHTIPIVPILIASEAPAGDASLRSPAADGVYYPVCTTPEKLADMIALHCGAANGPVIDGLSWERGRYSPTPTIVEAARELYAGHSVADISRSDAGAANLAVTSKYVGWVISESRLHRRKSICLLTGVPGAGKTLVGLDIATTHMDPESELYSVFLSGNGPLVAVLREALARDDVERSKAAGKTMRKGDARRKVETFVQNVHHFRDECLKRRDAPPEHVAIFDEAQRAWTREQTSNFMLRKKNLPDFNQSEPEFLIECMDRHPDWAVILCLVGGGQEINTGEAGIAEWIETLRTRFPDWQVHLSPRLTDSEYGSGEAMTRLAGRQGVVPSGALHLDVSMRSFRAERVSDWVKAVLDHEQDGAHRLLEELLPKYPIRITRNLKDAKRWLRTMARGSERYGLVVSSQAQRLKPHAIDVRVPIDPVHWFLDGREYVRSSYFMEDAATEFHVQGLELDWACVVWDADFRAAGGDWDHWSFVGDRWQRIRKLERQAYQKNSYRVLLTRARQGMVIVVPDGEPEDQTRQAGFYDSTYAYLRQVGLPEL